MHPEAAPVLHYFGSSHFSEPNPQADLDVVFVHGLTGDYVGTWSGGDNPDTFWPRWIAEEFPHLNVYSIAYDSSILNHLVTGSGPSLPERATILIDFLRSRPFPARKIYYIAHSLGGLIVKQMLRRCHDIQGKKYQTLLESTAGIAFLGTPHQGSSFGSSICTIFNVAFSKHVRQLAYGDAILVDLSEWFRHWANNKELAIESYHETLKTKGFMIVDAVTANPYISNCTPIAVHCDHIQIAKPDSRKAQIYVSITATLRDLAPQRRDGPSGSGSSGFEVGKSSSGDVISDHPQCTSMSTQLAEDFQFFTERSDDDRLSLAEKLSLAGRSHEIRRAERKKERFSMALHRHAAQPSALAEYVHLMADVEGRFGRHVSGLIASGAEAEAINQAVQSNVINPIQRNKSISQHDMSAASIDECLFYLTGNCHIRWDDGKI